MAFLDETGLNYFKSKNDETYASKTHTHNYAGSSSAGGPATSANKLNTNAGGVTTPVYFNDGIPVACTPYESASVSYASSAGKATTATKLSISAGSGTTPVYFSNGQPTACSYSLNKTVPSSAVFTDTKNTAGAANINTRIYLVGAESQADNQKTYSNKEVWTENGVIGAKSVSNGSCYFTHVGGGCYLTYGPTKTGFLKIKLPFAWTYSTLSFTVSVISLDDGISADYQISGRPGPNSAWANCTAVCICKAGQKISNLPVRFGTDGTNSLIYIGESDTSWLSPQIHIHDVCVGESNAIPSKWATGWSIDFTTTALTRTDSTILNTHVGYGSTTSWGNVSDKPSFSTVATSGSYNDLSNKPTIPSVGNGTVTITQNGVSKGSFTLNQSGNATIALTDTDTNTTYSAISPGDINSLFFTEG